MTEINRLSARRVQTLTKPGRHADGAGLYLSITPTGSKRWVFMYQRGKKQTELGIHPDRARGLASLAEARAARDRFRQMLEQGLDPKTARKAPVVKTFGEIADETIEAMRPKWRNAKHAAQWTMTLTVYAAPLRSLPVDQISTDHVLECLKPHWSARPETANRLRARIEAVLDRAKVLGLRSGENPARWRGHLQHLLAERQVHQRGSHSAMPIADIPRFAEELRAMEGFAPRALEWLVLTGTRCSETLGARWSEVDIEKAIWVIPPARTKTHKEHRVPLSDRCIEILKGTPALQGCDLVFPGRRRNQPFDVKTFTHIMRRMGRTEVTRHGFRATLATWAAEQGYSGDVIEQTLAHVIQSRVVKAYRRTDHFEARKALMQHWSDYCAGKTAKVINIERKVRR